MSKVKNANIHGSVAYSSKNNSLSPASSTAVCKLTTVTELAFSKNCVRATKSLVLSGISWTLSDISSQDLHSLQIQLQITLNQLLSLSLLFLTIKFLFLFFNKPTTVSDGKTGNKQMAENKDYVTKFQVENYFIRSMQEKRLIFTCFYLTISSFLLSLYKT